MLSVRDSFSPNVPLSLASQKFIRKFAHLLLLAIEKIIAILIHSSEFVHRFGRTPDITVKMELGL